MNDSIKEIAHQTGFKAIPGFELADNAIDHRLYGFAERIIQECIQCCGSQADRRNIRHRFGLPIESNVQYPSPDPHNSITSQYFRDLNLP